MDERITEPLVLVVDDEPGVCEALSSLLVPRLEPLYRVETAASAEEALAIVGEDSSSEATHPVALVISDEKMPGKSGTDLLIALRQNSLHRHGGRIIVTGYAGLASAKKAINEAEVDRYYPKPWDTKGDLLPAIGEILCRFEKQTEIDRFLLAAAQTGSDALADVLSLRRAWWEYVSLMDEGFLSGDEEDEAEAEIPSFHRDGDSEAVHIIARRVSPRENQPAGTVRLVPSPGDDSAIIDELAFQPEETDDSLESLLLRTAVLEAMKQNISQLRTAAPVLRRDVYDALGFEDTGAEELNPTPGTVPLIFNLSKPPGPNLPAWKEAPSRFAVTDSLCICSQAGCPSRPEYATDRRGFFCPLDLAEGRHPDELPRQDSRA